jgi:Flp pilus assembly protein TadG
VFERLPFKRAPRRRGLLGQSLLEFALCAPVLITLLLMGLDVAILIQDKVVAQGATREGARLAAFMGGDQSNPGVPAATLDQKVVQDIIAIGSRLQFATIQEIDIYKPTVDPRGRRDVADPVNIYNGAGVAQPTQTFLLTMRNQSVPYETNLGVRVTWLYNPPTGALGAPFTFNEYAVYKMAPLVLT